MASIQKQVWKGTLASNWVIRTGATTARHESQWLSGLSRVSDELAPAVIYFAALAFGVVVFYNRLLCDDNSIDKCIKKLTANFAKMFFQGLYP